MTTMVKIITAARLDSGEGALSRRWLPAAGVAVAAAAMLAACGGGSSSDNPSGGGNESNAQSGGKPVVSMQRAHGSGPTLVDSSGKTLYFSDEEKSGKVSCTDACLGFWFPLTVTDKTVTQPDGVAGKLGTVKRSDDGKLQVTYNGAPLYTFKLDTASGDAKGDNFSDDFHGSHFTWHAAGSTTSGSTSPSTAPTTMDDGYGDY